MKIKVLNLFFIFVCVLISLVLFGCKQDGIKFYRESGVQQFMRDSNQPNNTTVKNSSGVVIYRDNTVKDSTGGSAKFGPKELDFDLRIK